MKPLAISILMLGTLMFFALTAHASEAAPFVPALDKKGEARMERPSM